MPEVWNQFCDALSVVLAELEEDQFLILVAKRTKYYVQFAGLDEGMLIEAQSNHFIEKDALKLSDTAHEQLLDLGWNAPAYEPTHEEEGEVDGSSNFYLTFDVLVPYRTLAGLAIATLQQIYAVLYPRELKYSAFSCQGEDIKFSSLGITRSRY